MVKVKKKDQPKPMKNQRTLLQFHGFQSNSVVSNQPSTSKLVENSGIYCEHCGKQFENNAGKCGHKLFCKENPKRMAKANDFNMLSDKSDTVKSTFWGNAF